MWWHSRNRDHDLLRELRAHLELEAEEHRESGLADDQARYAAQRALGNTTSIQEEIREMSRWIFFDRLRQDLQYAWRTLGRNRGFTVVAVVTLALGIGANTAIFSLVNAVELRSLPVRDPQQLVMLEWSANQKVSWPAGHISYGGCDAGELGSVGSGCSVSHPAFEYFRSHTKLMSGVAAMAGPVDFQVRAQGQLGRAAVQFVSGDFFHVLGVGAQMGRTFDARDDRPDSNLVVVLSSRAWLTSFGGDKSIVGKTIALEGAAATVIGVADMEFFGVQATSPPDLWVPLHAGARLGEGWWNSLGPGRGWLFVFGRLRPDVPASAAQAELSVLLRQFPGSPEVFKPQMQARVYLEPMARGLSGLRRAYSTQLHVLMAVVGLVLLIACANIANLLLTRASARRREMAVRMAIGCSRARLLQQLATESLLLSGLGAGAGFLLADWASRALAALLASRGGSHTMLEVRHDPLVLGFTAGVSCVAALLFGLAPALAGTRERPALALRSGASSLRRSWLGRALVAAEMALALVLLVAAGLFAHTLSNLESLDSGFRRDHLLTFEVERPHDVTNAQPQAPVNAAVRDRLAGLPGVRSATWSSYVLLIGSLETNAFGLEGKAGSGEVDADTLHVGPRFFETMGIAVLAGRTIDSQDCKPDATAVWINQRLADKFGPGIDPVGRTVQQGKTKYEIAGIVGNAKYESIRGTMAPTVYMPSRSGDVFTLRTAGDPELLAAAVRVAVHDVNPLLLVDHVKSEAAQVDEQLFNERLMARLSLVFGCLALAMASIGIYGVLGFSVTRRTSEIAIRMSLGAMPGEILGMVLRDGMAPAAIGAAAGVAAAWGLTKLIATLLFGVQNFDAITYACATLLLLAVAALACYLPARRATRVNPVVALRYE